MTIAARPMRLTRTQRGQVRRATNRLLAVERREFPSASTPEKVYVAMILIDNRLTCDCQGWTIKKVGKARQCKHTTEMTVGRRVREDGEYLYLDRGEP